MRLLALAILFISISPLASLASEKTPEVVGSCGDHWLKVHFNANLKTKKAKISCSGDSQTQCDMTGKLVQKEGDTSFQIQFDEPSKGYLIIDGRDSDHNIYWGSMTDTGRAEDEKDLGLCSVICGLN
jgi:hypothetical protein